MSYSGKVLEMNSPSSKIDNPCVECIHYGIYEGHDGSYHGCFRNARGNESYDVISGKKNRTIVDGILDCAQERRDYAENYQKAYHCEVKGKFFKRKHVAKKRSMIIDILKRLFLEKGSENDKETT